METEKRGVRYGQLPLFDMEDLELPEPNRESMHAIYDPAPGELYDGVPEELPHTDQN